jgi:hypothetical protein
MPPESEDPVLLAILFCDAIHIDPDTHKRTILGAFGAHKTDRFPAPCNLCVYLVMTDFVGVANVTVKVVDVQENMIGESHERMQAFDRLLSADGVCLFRPLTFPAPGDYLFRVFVNGKLLDARRLAVRQFGQPLQGELP